MDVKDNHQKLVVATGRHCKFNDIAAIKAVEPLASSVLKAPHHYEADTLWLAAQAVTTSALSDESTCTFLNGTAKVCGLRHVCCTNKVLRAKGADHAQVDVTPTCANTVCNLHANHVLPPINMAEFDCGYTIPDEYVNVADR